jgi:hypothetical protein
VTSLEERGRDLADAVEAALPGWVERQVARYSTEPPDPSVMEQVVIIVMNDLRALLSLDVDAQREGPLSIVRRAAGPVNELLAERGVAPPERDDLQVDLFPDDTYDVVPANFADLSEAAGEAGIVWGATKAWEHKKRHT